MTFDPSSVPGGDVRAWGARCVEEALVGVAAQDWQAVHNWTKSWIGWGGGAWEPGPWLLYGVSGLLRSQPRIAVRGLDLGLKNWIDGPKDRAVLEFARGQIVRLVLKDPKTARADFEKSSHACPGWLRVELAEAMTACEGEALASRKRVASVEPRPDFERPAHLAESTVAPSVTRRGDGDQPSIWEQVTMYFS